MKRLILSVMLALVCSVSFAAHPAFSVLLGLASAIDKTLVLWFPFTTDNGDGTYTDESSYGNDGAQPVVASRPTWTNAYGGAYDFDGAGDYIAVPDDDTLDSAKLTIAFWIYSRDFIASIGVASKRDTSISENSWNIFSGLVDNRLRFQITEAGTAAGVVTTLTSGTDLSTNQWYHVAFVADGVSAIIYVDGVADGSAAAAFDVYAGTADIAIGSVGGFATTFDGILDEFQQFDRALSAPELLAIYNETQGDHP